MVNTVTYPSYTNTWLNSDGLPVRFGKGAQIDAVAGYASRKGDDVSVIYDIMYDRLPAFSASEAVGQLYGGYPNLYIPTGAFIKSAIMNVTTAFTGATATLSLGLVDKLGTTEIDNDGFWDAVAVASLTAGAVITGAGALINTTLATGGYLWASVQTATFTAGRARAEITYFIPAVGGNNS